MSQDKLTKILKDFGDRWVEAEGQWDIHYIGKRKKQLLKWVTRKIFLEHK